MQSVLRKMAFSAGALALGVGLSACGKVKDMPSSDKQSQNEAPAGDVVSKAFQGIWSDYGYVSSSNSTSSTPVLTPHNVESHLKIAADGTIFRLSKYEVAGSGPDPRKVTLQYEEAGKVTMITPHSTALLPKGIFLETLLASSDHFGLSAPSFEMVRFTNGEKPEICILAWEGDHGGYLGGSNDFPYESQCYQRFTLKQMEDYFRDKAKQSSGH